MWWWHSFILVSISCCWAAITGGSGLTHYPLLPGVHLRFTWDASLRGPPFNYWGGGGVWSGQTFHFTSYLGGGGLIRTNFSFHFLSEEFYFFTLCLKLIFISIWVLRSISIWLSLKMFPVYRVWSQSRLRCSIDIDVKGAKRGATFLGLLNDVAHKLLKIFI